MCGDEPIFKVSFALPPPDMYGSGYGRAKEISIDKTLFHRCKTLPNRQCRYTGEGLPARNRGGRYPVLSSAFWMPIFNGMTILSHAGGCVAIVKSRQHRHTGEGRYPENNEKIARGSWFAGSSKLKLSILPLRPLRRGTQNGLSPAGGGGLLWQAGGGWLDD